MTRRPTTSSASARASRSTPTLRGSGSELARRAGRLVGFAYGYTGRRGQWWSDRVLARVPATITDLWVDGHFECSGWQELARIDEDSALLVWI